MRSKPSSPGIIIAAPSSGSGKTVITLALLAALKQSGCDVASAKVGPDYIDPAFHTAATERPCYNLDQWAMRTELLAGLCTALSQSAPLVVCEGVMGLFDGANSGAGSTADLAALTGWPVVLVVDVRGQAASAVATVRGFASHREDVDIRGVIFNRVGSEAHRRVIETAMRDALPKIELLGFIPRSESLILPERHLGLVQAREHQTIGAWLENAARLLVKEIDLERFKSLARPVTSPSRPPQAPLPPLGQHIAVARDDAFSFTYENVLDGWRRQNAEISFFSPLDNQSPASSADAVYLPGGYPELHAGRLAGNRIFLQGLKNASRDAFIFGECGGFMVLGETLIDDTGAGHRMANLLPVKTSFANPKLHLGYRRAKTTVETPLGPRGVGFCGHEFHYCSAALQSGGAASLFECEDSSGSDIGAMGLIVGRVAGSFLHLIDHSA
jgi:cobyrinic acid a,c-diamide synthase